MHESQLRFVYQQGYSVPASDALYEALMLQPRIIGCLVVVGTWFQSAWMFLALSGVLWLATALPEWNVFNAMYNTFIAYPLGLTPLGAAPPPRRFAMGMAAAFALAIGAALVSGATTTAWILEGLLAIAVVAVVFGRFCAGAYTYQSLRCRLSAAPQSVPTRLQERH
jgi:Domain of unknown function (DUF4395)